MTPSRRLDWSFYWNKVDTVEAPQTIKIVGTPASSLSSPKTNVLPFIKVACAVAAPFALSYLARLFVLARRHHFQLAFPLQQHY